MNVQILTDPYFFSETKSVRRNSAEESDPVPRSGRRIRSAEEIEKIMKTVEKYAPTTAASKTTTGSETTTEQQQQQHTSSENQEEEPEKFQRIQQPPTPPPVTRVQIHNIRSSLPRPEIEMIYTVYQGTNAFFRHKVNFSGPWENTQTLWQSLLLLLK